MPFTLEQLAQRLGLRFQGDAGTVLCGMAGIEEAGAGELTFVANARYRNKLRTTRAAAAIVPPDLADAPIPVLISSNPYGTFARALAIFHPEVRPEPGISPAAWVEPSAALGAGVTVFPFAYVGQHAAIGAGTVLYPFACVGEGARVGQDCRIHAHVSVRERCIVGDRVILHDGAVVGADGFGFAQEDGRHLKIPQVGIVRIEDDVEIGANSCVDRATLGETRIGRGAKIDNLVQVAHNVRIGEDAVLVSQVGISGSTVVGDRAVLAGQVGAVGHIRIGNDVKVGAKSGIHASIRDGEVVSGIPTMPYEHFLKTIAAFKRLPQLRERVFKLESEIRALRSCLEAAPSPGEGAGAGGAAPAGGDARAAPADDRTKGREP
ncbi:MAG: UDP-3-O-(3-hydroxymyristoyl)glucosamine N-acyltransferase [bacterium]